MIRNFTIFKKAFVSFCFLTFILISLYSNAQDWQPIRLNEKYNYRLEEATLATNTLYADSAKVINGDSVFYLNRIIAKCDTCKAANLGGTNPPCDTCYWLSNQPQFLQRKMLEKASGVYHFNDPDTLNIKTLTTIGESWIYDTKKNISATVLNIKLKEVFGVIDSVKTIALSTKDTIEISKSFGIIKFPDGRGKSYSLSGIEGTREIGEKIPGFKEIFDFNVGDEFETHEMQKTFSHPTNYNHPLSYDKWIKKYKITGKKVEKDQLVYRINGKMIYIQDSTSTIYSEINEDLVYPYTEYSHVEILRSELNSLITINFDNYGFYDDIKLAIDSNGITTKYIALSDFSKGEFFDNFHFTHDFNQANRDLYILEPKSKDLFYYNVSYKVGLGLSHLHEQRFAHIFIEREFDLVAYKKGDKIVGKFTPDSLLTSAKTPTIASLSIHLYPNPANDRILIDYKEAEPGQLEILNLEGIKVKQSSISTNNSEIQVSDLREGIYILKVTNSSKIFIQKFTVQK